MVSDDVPLDDLRMVLWGWFTRFDPLADLHPAGRKVEGNRMILETPIAIDAAWKEGYRKPVAFDPDIAQKVDDKWDSYGIDLSGAGK
jgi:3-polyprenyl-4-hydroxybenzoate decarboxylase